MADEHTEILIAGGGIAGLTAAAAFGSAGFRVICIDPTPPVTNAAAKGADLRTTAFLQPAKAFLERAGIWQRLADFATPLQVMRIIDAGGPKPEARQSRDFDAAEISDAPFGWNLPNWLLRREILARLSELDNVSFRPGVGFEAMTTRNSVAIVRLSDGNRLRAQLVIAADGRNSAVRDALGIGVKTTRYGQKAVTFSATHQKPHGNVSTEIHRSGGPFTLVPLPDHAGQPCSGVVWMEDGPEALRLAALPEAEFETRASERAAQSYGPLKLVSRRMVWPIISQIADRLSGERTALVAEAAHVVPPIGAQGLNMSLSDINCLLDLSLSRPDGLGDAKMLETYHRLRHKQLRLRLAGVDALNRVSMAQGQVGRDLRNSGLRALYGAAPLRRELMRIGLGAGRKSS